MYNISDHFIPTRIFGVDLVGVGELTKWLIVVTSS